MGDKIMGNQRKKVVVLGAGAAGIMAANRLRKSFRADDVGITVIDREDKHYYQPGYLTLAFHMDTPESLVRDTRKLLVNDITFRQDEATGIDVDSRAVQLRNGDLPYDYLIIATGLTYADEAPEGLRSGLELKKKVFNFYTLQGALALRDALDDFNGGTIVSSITEMPIRCPAAPTEFILLCADTLRRRGLLKKTRLVVTVPAPFVPPQMEPFKSYVRKRLDDNGIEVLTEFKPIRIDGAAGTYEDSAGRKLTFDLMAVVPPNRGEPVVKGVDGLTDQAGWVIANKETLQVERARNIFVIGDASNFPNPKTAAASRKEAQVLRARLTATLQSKEPSALYDGETICPVLTDFGHAFFVHFNYTRALRQVKEDRATYYLHVYLLKYFYWDYILKGNLFK